MKHFADFRRENRKRLTVDEVDNGNSEQESENRPPRIGWLFLASCVLRPVNRGTGGSTFSHCGAPSLSCA